MKKINQHGNKLPDLIPDVIPEQKKPLEDPCSESYEEDLDDYNELKSEN